MHALTPTDKRIVGLARLAGFQVKVATADLDPESYAIAAIRHARVGLSGFRIVHWSIGERATKPGPECLVIHAGWWWWPSSVTDLEAALVGEVYRIRAPAT